MSHEPLVPSALPSGYRLRHPADTDLPAIQKLVDDCEATDSGERRASDWSAAASFVVPGSAPHRNWWLLEHEEEVVGFARVIPEEPGEAMSELFTAAAERGRGLTAHLVAALEASARDMAATAPGERLALHILADDRDADHQGWLLAHGYQRARDVFVMRTDLSSGPAAPAWPPDINVRRMRPGIDDEALWAADVEAFAEHFLFSPGPLDTWRACIYEHAGFDPDCYVVAWDGDEVAGQALAMPGADPGIASVQDVMVRKPWRGRGLGSALLLEAFAALHRLGRDDVSVWVDAQNETGAVRLYEAAGMSVWRRFGVFRQDIAARKGRPH